MVQRLSYVALVGAIALAATAVPAGAHQIASNNGVSVQVHVDPNDEPVAGEKTTVWVVRVKARNATFAWKTCRCKLKVFDSSGAVLLDSAATVARTPVTFPDPKAYGITFTGRVKKKAGGWKSFRVTYAIRAGSSE